MRAPSSLGQNRKEVNAESLSHHTPLVFQLHMLRSTRASGHQTLSLGRSLYQVAGPFKKQEKNPLSYKRLNFECWYVRFTSITRRARKADPRAEFELARNS